MRRVIVGLVGVGIFAGAAGMRGQEAQAGGGAAAAAQTGAKGVVAQAAPDAGATAQGGTIQGTVHAGAGVGAAPLPGVAVTATNTLTGKKYSTATDVTGAFRMAVPLDGRYVVRAELMAFASQTTEVRLSGAKANGGTNDAVAGFELQLASRVAAAQAASAAGSGGGTGFGVGGRGTRGAGLQALTVTGGLGDAMDASVAGGGSAGVSMPSLAGLGSGDAAGAESVAVSGQMGQTNGLANVSEDEIRQRIQDAVAQARRQGGANADTANAVVGMLGGMMSGGGFGGPGGGGGRGGRGGGGGFGVFRGFNPTQPHGSIFYQGANGALDATNYSLSGVPVKPGYNNNRFGVTFAGSPFIPGLLKASTKQFVFLNVTGQRNINPVNLYGTVPTVAERGGDFSGLTQSVNGVAMQTPIYDPVTGQQFNCNGALNVICSNRLSPQALALLNYYPAANIAAVGTRGYNYQTITTAGSNAAQASLRYVRNFGATSGPFGGFRGGRRQAANGPKTLRQNINFNGSYSHTAADNRNLFLIAGGATETDGYGVTAGYTVGYGRLTNNASINWNRSHATVRNYFTNMGVSPAQTAGIAVPSQGVIGAQPGFYNGLPNLTITNFSSLNEQTPRDAINQTISFSDFVSWSHKRHNMRAGVDVRRVHADSLGGNNVVGSFIFSGFVTQNPMQQTSTATGTTSSATGKGGTAQAPTGAGFADFLLGAPQSTAIQAGLAKIYLRANVYDWYVTDDWRVLPSVTLNYGLRYEYFSPYVEKDNRLVNLDHNADFTDVSPVEPDGVGPYTGKFRRSLVNPDRTMFSPRFGVAWRPKFVKNTVVRGGYGINYNTGQFATFAQNLAFQPPFALTQTNVLSTMQSPTGCTAARLTLASGFGCSTKAIQNNYSVNPDYRLGRVQVYNLDLQRTLPMGVVLNVGYTGSKGGDLDILRAPNHSTNAVTTANAQAFTYEDSVAESRFNGLAVNARKRMQRGISLQGTYHYGHSIDNASSIGGSGTGTTVQNDARLDLEEGNSSFDVRHQLTGNWVFELPFGPNRQFFANGGRTSKILDGFSLSGDFTFATGSYFTPQYSSTAAQIAAGGLYTLRPDRVFSQPIAGPGSVGQWFNPAAFVAPANGFGTASRNSIRGPGVVGVDASLSRTQSLGDTRSFEARVTAGNVFNTVQYSGVNTTLDSATFGQVTSTAAARRLSFVARYRF